MVILDLNELGEEREVRRRRRTRGERRRQPARLLARHRGLPPVHAPREGPPHRQARARARSRGSTRSRSREDGKTLFYVTEDAQTKRSNQLYRARPRGRRGEGHARLRGEGRALRPRGSSARGARRFVVVTSREPDDERGAHPRRARPEGAARRSSRRGARATSTTSTTGADSLYIRTNSGGRNFRLVTAPFARPRSRRSGRRSCRTGRT